MVNMQQRLEALRTQKGVSRVAVAAALGLPRMAMEKFETGRQTPTQDQQKKLAEYYGVSLAYLRGESDDASGAETWLNGTVPDEPKPAPAAERVPQSAKSSTETGPLFHAMLKSDAFRALLRETVLDVLRSPEGQELLAKAARR